jgi:hypothetical protein
MARNFLVSGAFLLLAACVPEAPRELDGLWSRSEPACAMGAGVRFEVDAVRVFLGRDETVLFDSPRYKVERRGRRARITIDYVLPVRRGGPGEGGSEKGGRGRLILARDAGDWIRPVLHQFADKGSGAVSLPLGDDDATRYFTLRRCADPSVKTLKK